MLAIIAKITGKAKTVPKKSTPPEFEKKVFTAVSKKVILFIIACFSLDF